jgi:hypothetical protein
MLFGCPVMPLINADDPSPASTHVVQHSFGHFQAHPEALQPRGQRPAQIM